MAASDYGRCLAMALYTALDSLADLDSEPQIIKVGMCQVFLPESSGDLAIWLIENVWNFRLGDTNISD